MFGRFVTLQKLLRRLQACQVIFKKDFFGIYLKSFLKDVWKVCNLSKHVRKCTNIWRYYYTNFRGVKVSLKIHWKRFERLQAFKSFFERSLEVWSIFESIFENCLKVCNISQNAWKLQAFEDICKSTRSLQRIFKRNVGSCVKGL